MAVPQVTKRGAKKPLALHQPISPTAPPALIKAFKWRDLPKPDEHGVPVKYRIVAMQGPAAKPVPLPDIPPLMTDVVTSTPHYRSVDAYFNRGILSTQALANMLIPYGGVSVPALQKALADKKGRVRAQLPGQLQDAILSPLEQREKEGGECYAALYELTDDLRIGKLVEARGKLHMLSNNTVSPRVVIASMPARRNRR